MEIFRLFGSIFVDNDEADKSIKKTDKNAEGLGSKLGGVIKTAGKFGLALGAAAAGAGAAMMGAATKAAEATDRIDKLSQKIGLSREAFQEWDFIASQSGMDVEKLQGGFKNLGQRMEEMAKGTGEGAEQFAKLGISVQDSNGALRSQEDVFEEAVSKLQQMEDGTEKARIAQELFGRAGSEMMPLLNGAAGSVEEMKEKAHELGLVIGDDAVDAGVAFTDTMDQLTRSFGAVFTQVGVHVMPIIQTFAQWIMSQMPTIQRILKISFDFMSAGVERLTSVFNDYLLPVLNAVWEFFGQYLSPIFKEYSNYIQGNLPIIRDLFSKVFSLIVKVASDVWAFFKNNLLPIFLDLYEWISGHMPTIRNTIAQVFSKIVESVRIVWEWFMQNLLPILVRLFDFVRSRMPQIQRIIEGAFSIIKSVVMTVWDIFENLLLPVLAALWKFIEPHIPKIQKIVEDAFDKIFNSVEVVVGVFEDVTEAVRKAIDWLTFWDDTDPEPKNLSVNETRTTTTRGVDRNATGTEYFAGGSTIVGERGPELVQLPRGSKVFPANETRHRLQPQAQGDLVIEVPVILEGREVARGTYRYISELTNADTKQTMRARGLTI